MSEPEDEENISNSDISKSKLKNKSRKRKRSSSSDGESILPENALEMEKNLHASAIKNNLDDVSVKKILKKVITNDHVLALVKLREEEEESCMEEKFRPKLTRSKVKELRKVSPKSAPWNLENLELTPIKHIPVKTRPEVEALIAQELPDDEDDDEYEPTHDDVQSDEDHALESCSDIDSLPRTPATPRRPSVTSPKLEKDGPFKVPQILTTPPWRRPIIEEEATIALRTRSKLSLSATPIEHIESSFVPPDDVPTVDVDDPVWNEFLEECLNPTAVSNVKNEDDEDADPEYNVAADPDAHNEDEALENSIIKISKKELNDLVTELFSIMPEETPEDELAAHLANNVLAQNNNSKNNVLWDGKQELKSDEDMPEVQQNRTVLENSGDICFSIGKNEPQDDFTKETPEGTMQPANPASQPRSVQFENAQPQNNLNNSVTAITGVAMTVHVAEERSSRLSESPPPQAPLVLRALQPAAPLVHVQLPAAPTVLPEQIQILQQQLRQHIQLATSNFLQLFVHPIHWKYAPKYKEYLETLDNLATTNPNSVVNVCNLKPAIELVAGWETSVSKATPENTEMVNFVQKQLERSRTRSAQNALYVGEFHDTLKDAVANSPVFLYPYLLPAMPYRPDSVRRFKFLRPEDELIALGLDEFWEYVEMNPQLFKRKNNVTQGRWGLKATVRLMCRHLMPWCIPRSLLAHLHYVRRTDKENPIYKFFQTRKVEPVKHKLLPFNPSLTLYEQPEYEMPRIWVRHLAKTSKRFKNYLYRRTNVTGVKPAGLDIEFGKSVKQAEKKPLPIDFTKVITIDQPTLMPKITKPQLIDKVDVHIQKEQSNTCEQSYNTLTIVNDKLQQTTMDDSISEPIYSPIENRSINANELANAELKNTKENTVGSHEDNNSTLYIGNDKAQRQQRKSYSQEHCQCCVLMRKICRERQTLITEYFKPEPYNVANVCHCRSISRPRITNKLRLLLKYYKCRSLYVHKEMKLKLAQCNQNNDDFEYANIPNDEVTELDDVSDPSDMEFVHTFQTKLLIRLGLARNRYIKQKMYVLFRNFDHESDDPAQLATTLEKYFDVELVDIFKEFLRCLTPEQADRINKFKDYFTQACASDLVKRITSEVSDRGVRQRLLSRLARSYTEGGREPCALCSELLRHMPALPTLAAYTFSLFPHRTRHGQESQPIASQSSNSRPKTQRNVSVNDAPLVISEKPRTVMDYEAEHSSSTDEDRDDAEKQTVNEKSKAVSKEKEHVKDKTTSVGSEQKNALTSDEHTQWEQSMNTVEENDMKVELIMSDDDSVKSETAEWQRSEDKLILEILKHSLTREERSDKTLLDILEEKEILNMITQSLSHKSVKDVTERVMYLVELLVLSET